MKLLEELKEMVVEKSFSDISTDDVELGMDLVENLGYNSIALVLLIIEIEEKWKISLDSEDINTGELSNFQYLYDTVSRLISIQA